MSKKVILKSSDGEAFEVDESVAVESQAINHMMEDGCAGHGIPLPNLRTIFAIQPSLLITKNTVGFFMTPSSFTYLLRDESLWGRIVKWADVKGIDVTLLCSFSPPSRIGCTLAQSMHWLLLASLKPQIISPNNKQLPIMFYIVLFKIWKRASNQQGPNSDLPGQPYEQAVEYVLLCFLTVMKIECKYHVDAQQVAEDNSQAEEIKNWDVAFVRVDQAALFVLVLVHCSTLDMLNGCCDSIHLKRSMLVSRAGFCPRNGD
ncbi:uncharacterized protein LOC105420075 [Amborella trichopoda]|uniref:uncharacterized protein LOC105420075 n=1 Tax=Amborella trichopoda TaxID=13333 RepID=UPI0009C08FE4|nr:uncharacterized protein LOC105420075 [Amborella trichopoda]|eukprot:XP_020518240.1 uncharacterized protein LOC105420075 [Amborella trichopoda]